MDWLSIREFLLDSIKFIIVIFIVLILFLYVVSITQVVGNSMYPTLQNQEVLVLNKAIYRFSDVKRGDIISLSYADTKYLIKRVVGLPGDTIEFRDNTLYINGEVYEEDYLGDDVITDDFSLQDIGYDVIPEDMYLVLGDNRQNSMDGRDIGLIKKSDIIGKIALRFWPINRFKLFLEENFSSFFIFESFSCLKMSNFVAKTAKYDTINSKRRERVLWIRKKLHLS